MVGEATKPQFLPYKQKMTVMDVMIAVGGLTDFADGNKATIVRAAESNKRYSVRLQDLVKRGDISANVEMLPATFSSSRRAGSKAAVRSASGLVGRPASPSLFCCHTQISACTIS